MFQNGQDKVNTSPEAKNPMELKYKMPPSSPISGLMPDMSRPIRMRMADISPTIMDVIICFFMMGSAV